MFPWAQELSEQRALKFLLDKLENRFISRRSECLWFAHSSDPSPLDYWFWGHVDFLLSKKQLVTMVELKIMMQELAATFE